MQVFINGLDCVMDLFLLDLTVASMSGVCRVLRVGRRWLVVFLFFSMREKTGSGRSIVWSCFPFSKVTFATLFLRIFLNSEEGGYC